MVMVSWIESGVERSARWRSENGTPAPARIEVADDAMTANAALRLIGRGTSVLWRGDYHNARQLLKAVGRRVDQRAAREHASGPRDRSTAELFRSHRAARAERARILGGILVLLEPGPRLTLRRAPDVTDACRDAYGDLAEPTLVSLTELVGVLSAWQWHLQGVPIPALDAHIHPRYGVFSPSRSEYIDLVARAPLPAVDAGPTVFDLGTGIGVLAAVLARRGASRVVATDINPRAVACARDNMQRLGLEAVVTAIEADVFPPGQADLVVCNPPWLPGEPTSALEQGVYDADSAMLRDFLTGLTAHLTPVGEGWLIISDLAEHLGLRTATQLQELIAQAGLEVVGSESTPARHGRAADPHDLLHAARRQEVTTLWRLRPAAR